MTSQSPSSDIYRERRCHTPSIKAPCVPVSSNDCGIAPINSGRVHNVPLYKRRTKILSHPPPNRVTPVFGTQIFHVDTFDINSIRQGLVPIHGSAVFIRVTRRARSSVFSLPYTATGSHTVGSAGQMFTRPVPHVPESLYRLRAFRCLCGPERSVWTSLVPRMSTANFPPLRGHFTGPQVCLSDHFATGCAAYACIVFLSEIPLRRTIFFMLKTSENITAYSTALYTVQCTNRKTNASRKDIK